MRERYKNGDPISLDWNGCDGCAPAVINGHFCHETGCPYAWKDYPFECDECGGDFQRESRFQTVCPDCLCPPEEEDDSDDPETEVDEL